MNRGVLDRIMEMSIVRFGQHRRLNSYGHIQGLMSLVALLVCLGLFSAGSAVMVGQPQIGGSSALSSLRTASGGESLTEDFIIQPLVIEVYDQDETNIHVVEDGDNLWSVASDYGTGVEAIVRANDITYAHRLKIGQQMRIPAEAVEGPDLLDLCRPRIERLGRMAGDPDWPAMTKTIHTVGTGENLWAIAQQHGVDVPTLYGANEHLDGSYIHPGDKIVVPSQKGILLTIKGEKSLTEIADRYRVPLATVARANRLSHDAGLLPGQEVFVPGGRPLDRGTFIWPLANFGRISSSFGYRTHPISRRRRWHSGVDLTACYGTSIRAARSGRVVDCSWNGGLGQTVILQHDGGFQTVYGHCSQIRVKKNQYVQKGQIIAAVGSTGQATGPHLHFEVRKSGRPVNPLRYLPYW